MAPEELTLERKVAVVTGSSRGLGRAFAMALAGAGAQVVVNGTNSDGVRTAVEEIRQHGGRAVGCVESVASMDGAKRVVEAALDHFGRIDILVNNAGVARDRTLLKMTEEEWDTVIDIHLKGTFACTKYAAPHMREQKWGRIINMSSAAGAFGNFGQTNYGAAKAGILSMTLTWATELGSHGITVNAVRAAAATKMTEPNIERARQEAREAGQPEPQPDALGYFEPEAAAPLVVFLSSDKAQRINGQFISIDGPKIMLWSRPRPVRTVFVPTRWTVELLENCFLPIIETALEPYGGRALEAIVGARLQHRR